MVTVTHIPTQDVFENEELIQLGLKDTNDVLSFAYGDFELCEFLIAIKDVLDNSKLSMIASFEVTNMHGITALVKLQVHVK